MKKFILLSVAFVSLAGCGFSPMYGAAFNDGKEIQTEYRQIEIGRIQDYEGQFLRNALIDRLHAAGESSNAKYELQVSKISESIIGLDVTKTSDVTRSQMTLRTTMTLVDKQSGAVVLTRPLKAIASFNELNNEFATNVSERATRENALSDLARQVELQLGLYFRRGA